MFRVNVPCRMSTVGPRYGGQHLVGGVGMEVMKRACSHEATDGQFDVTPALGDPG